MGYSLRVDIHICQLLFLIKGNTLSVDGNRQTLRHLHASSCCLRVESLMTLKDTGVNLMQNDHQRRTVLHSAAISGSLAESSLSFMLYVVGVQIDAKDVSGITAVQYATEMAPDNLNRDMWDFNQWNTPKKILLRFGASSLSRR